MRIKNRSRAVPAEYNAEENIPAMVRKRFTAHHRENKKRFQVVLVLLPRVGVVTGQKLNNLEMMPKGALQDYELCILKNNIAAMKGTMIMRACRT